MKKILLLFTLLILVICAKSQTLQFEEALFIELSGFEQTTNTAAATYVLTIPTGKMAKITAASVGRTINGLPNNSSASLYLNGNTLHASSVSPIDNVLPIWLPPGQYTFVLIANGTTGYAVSAYVTGILLNKIP